LQTLTKTKSEYGIRREKWLQKFHSRQNSTKTFIIFYLFKKSFNQVQFHCPNRLSSYPYFAKKLTLPDVLSVLLLQLEQRINCKGELIALTKELH
jgi:hypothetical protein